MLSLLVHVKREEPFDTKVRRLFSLGVLGSRSRTDQLGHLKLLSRRMEVRSIYDGPLGVVFSTLS